ncbi:MAG: hypothetical protein ACKV19_18955 [Verrucomicrobiales bacterium]
MNPDPAIAAVLAALRGEGFGIEDGASTAAADGAALVMLGVICFMAGLIAAFAWTMRRRSQRPDPTLEFLARLRDEQKPSSPDVTASAGESWERPADWWKRDRPG